MSPALKVEPLEQPFRVLLVEDDVILRGLLAEAMRDAGLIAVEAANADEARRYMIAGGRADLVVTDVEMPGSMNGIAFAKWVRQNHPRIQLILTSGSAAPGAREVGLFIPKPYKILETAEIARKMVGANRGEDR